MSKVEIKNIYPLSPMQESMLFHSLREKNSTAYFEQMTIRVKGKIDIEKFGQSFQQLVDRYDVLRTIFRHQKVQQPIQIVLKARKVGIHFEDIRYFKEKEHYLSDFLHQDREAGFDLSKDVLMRLAVFRLTEDEYAIVWSHHHILMDGWCMAILFSDFTQIYQALLNGSETQLESVYPFSDYIEWLTKKDAKRAEIYWKEKLGGLESTVFPLPKKNGSSAYLQEKLSLTLSPDLVEKIKAFSAKQGGTLNHYLQAAWAILLHKYTAEEQVVFGSVISGRPAELPGVEQMVGLFINTIPVQFNLHDQSSIGQLIQEAAHQGAEANEYGYLPLSKVQSLSPLKNDLITHLMVFENYPVGEKISEEKASALGYTVEDVNLVERTNYDLNILVMPGEEFKIIFDFNANVLDPQLIRTLGNFYERIIIEAVKDLEKEAKSLALSMAPNELAALKGKVDSSTQNLTITQQFQRVCEQYSDRKAIIGQEPMSYQQLDQQSTGLALEMINRGIQKGQVVACVQDNTPQFIVSVLAAIKSGAICLPIDPENPKERVQTIISEAQTQLILHQGIEEPVDLNIPMLNVDEFQMPPNGVHLPRIDGSDIAYLIFTSGSTGKPKGVLIRHDGFMNMILDQIERYDIQPEDKVLKFASPSFDASVFELFLALLSGASLLPLKRSLTKDLFKFKHFMFEYQPTVVLLPPVFLNSIDRELPDSVRVLITAGESANPSDTAFYSNKLRYFNAYGPTEYTVCASVFEAKPMQEVPSQIPIGYPVKNTEIFILDEGRNLQPRGAKGEICLAGAGLSAGYLNQPDLSDEKFIPNPLGEGKIYLTGDLGYVNAQGQLVYEGRKDDQVKVRGYRIELGEIEAVCLSHPEGKDIKVLARGEGADKALVAWYTTHQPTNTIDWKAWLHGKLPSYMLPSHFVQLDSIPLTTNGKVDKNALPQPEPKGLEEWVAPENELEEKLLALWQEILEVESLGTENSFFDLGGHSLKATILMGRIHKHFNCELSLSEFFENPTIKNLALLIEKAAYSDFSSIQPAPSLERYPLSAAQQRLMVLEQMNETGIAYNIPAIYAIEGDLNPQKIAEVFNTIIAYNDAFRTAFQWVEGQAYQVIQSEVDFEVEILPPHQPKDLFKTFVRPFDLENPPLLRVGLSQQESKNYLLIDMHHLVSDGVSMDLLVNQFQTLYQGGELETKKLQYIDFAFWQKKYFESPAFQDLENYWLNRFQDQPSSPVLPLDFQRPKQVTYAGDKVFGNLSQDNLDKLKQIASENGVTLFSLIYSMFFVWLYKITGQNDLVVGTPVAGRPHTDLEGVVGMFVNMIPVRCKLNSSKEFSQFLREFNASLSKDVEHSNYPFEYLVKQLNLDRDTERNPIFDVVFSHTNSSQKKASSGFKALELFPPVAKFDLSLESFETQDGLHFHLEYKTALFKRENAQSLMNRFLRLLETVAYSPKQKIASLECLEEHEKSKIFALARGEQKEISKQWFEHVDQIFRQFPNKKALVAQGESLTWEEVEQASNAIASKLENHISKGQFVPILSRKTKFLVPGILGIMKAGGVYLPLDENYPLARLEFILKDCQATLVVSDYPAEQGKFQVPVLELEALAAEGNTGARPWQLSASDTAYLIYTSGSTGMPKGAQISHGSLSNLCQWHREYYAINEHTVSGQYASLNFDASILEIFPYLSAGSEIHFLPEDIRYNIHLLNQYYHDHQVDIGFLPTQLAEEFMELPNGHLTKLLVGGERLKKMGAVSYGVYNNYGPTESTVVAAVSQVSPKDRITIGSPILNHEILILDQDQNLVPTGFIGEICIAGAGLSSGYLNREKLTAERFIDHPFRSGEKLYRSGDLARYLENGELEYLGRMDHQVKVRGHRIELGEVENALLELEGIQSAVVVDRRDAQGNTFLAAYLVGESGQEIESGKVREQLGQMLPDYMVPAFVVGLEKLPLTPNGKIDRKALPEPVIESKEKKHAPPANATEAVLIEVWEEVLGQKNIGRNDSFFAVGGDSIKAIQVSSRLYKHQLKVEIKDIFKYPKVSDLAKYVKPVEQVRSQASVQGEVLLTPIQRWFYEQKLEAPHHYNQSVMLYHASGIEEETLKQVMEKLLAHHDALRMTFTQEEGGVKAFIHDYQEGKFVELHAFDLRGHTNPEKAIEAHCEELQSSFELSVGPLMKLGLFHTDEGSQMLWVIHHLVVDGVSWRILLEDLNLAYRQAQAGQAIELPEKTDSFQSWAQALEDYSQSEALLGELEYWKTVEQPLQEDPISGKGQHAYQQLEFSLDAATTKQLLTKANAAYHTEINDLLLSALCEALSAWDGEKKHWINMEGHGREQIAEGIDTSRTVGWFTSTYPVQLENAEEAMGGKIKRIKEQLRRIPKKGIGYGVLRYLSNIEGVEFGRQPEISFNYLGQFDQDFQDRAFQPSRLSTGENIGAGNRPNFLIDFTALTANKQLRMVVNYNSECFQEQSIIALGEQMQSSLKAMVKHCVEKDQPEFSPADFGATFLSLPEFDDLYSRLGNRIEKLWNLSPMQNGMVFHQRLNPDSPAYFEQADFFASGSINPQFFQQALQALSERYEIIRAGFYTLSEQPAQVILKDRTIEFHYHDFTTSNGEPADRQVEALKAKDKKRGFDLLKDALMRVHLVKQKEGEYRIIWSHHHILIDGWCLKILIQDFLHFYEGLYRKGQLPELKPAPSFENYLNWLKDKLPQGAKKFWNNYLQGLENSTGLVAKGEGGTYKQESHEFSLPEEISSRLHSLATSYQVSFNHLIQSCWAVLLQKCTNQNKVVFGTVVSGRPPQVPEVENMVGLFINTVPVKVDFDGVKSIASLADTIKTNALEREEFIHLPLADIQAQVEGGKDLIDHILLFENHVTEDETSDPEKTGFVITGLEAFEQTTYPLNVSFIPGKELEVKCKFDASAIGHVRVADLCERFESLLKQVAEGKEELRELSFISTLEQEKLLAQSTGIKTSISADKNWLHLFQESVESFGNKVALKSGGKSLSYKALDEYSNGYCLQLQKSLNLQPGELVGVQINRDIESLPLLIGILKAGAAYLPIDPDCPTQRLKHILDDSGCTKLVRSKGFDPIESNQVKVYQLSGELPSPAPSMENFTNRSGDECMYITYTSGSTGKPKGVKVSHANVVAFVQNLDPVFGISDKDCLLSLTHMTFDISVMETFCCLAKGVTVIYGTQEEVKEPEKIKNLMIKEEVSAMQLTPSRLKFITAGEDFSSFEQLKTLVVGGEPFPEALKSKLLSIDGLRVFNVYGPTETTIWSTCSEVGKEKVNIGKPLLNERTYLLSTEGKFVPPYVTGEIFIAGSGISQGYLNRSELNAERYVPDPFVEGEIMYRTGDLGQWNDAGEIVFLGRNDDQVKVRGYRIETGEVEAALLSIPEIKGVHVGIQKLKETDHLMAWYVSEQRLQVDHIKSILEKELPAYMVPDYFIALDAIPLNANGKVDRKQLPLPQENKVASEELPKTLAEKLVAEVWKEVLGLEEVAVNKSFFALGGHSLKMVTVVNKLQEKVELDVPLNVIFNHPTIKELAAYINYLQNVGAESLERSITLLNKVEAKNNLFFIPPMVAYPFIYQELAAYLKDHNVYGFTFIEAEDRLQQYVDHINEIQPEGPVTLVTYSAGGGLTFFLAKALLESGREVKDVILFDCYRRIKSETVSDEERAYAIDYFYTGDPEEKPHLKSKYITEKLKKKVNIYFDYGLETVVEGKLPVNIHLITAPEKNELHTNDTVDSEAWQEVCGGEFKSYQGYGNHANMMEEPQLKGNAKVLNAILEQIATGNQVKTKEKV